eukprot:gene5269-7146_t
MSLCDGTTQQALIQMEDPNNSRNQRNGTTPSVDISHDKNEDISGGITKKQHHVSTIDIHDHYHRYFLNNYDNPETKKADSERIHPEIVVNNNRTLVDHPSTFQRKTITGLCRYAWSSLSRIFSADLLIVYVIDAYLTRFQKVDRAHKLRKLRAHERWDFATFQQSIEQFRVERRSRASKKWSDTDQSSMLATTTTTAEVDGRIAKLPPYYRLCFMVQKDLCESLQVMYTLRRIRITTPLSYLLAFSGIGHWFTEIGRLYWTIVMRKFILFVWACMGIWFDESYKGYDIKGLVKEFTIREPDEVTMEFLKLTIASRVILLQALGSTTTLISIIVINI